MYLKNKVFIISSLLFQKKNNKFKKKDHLPINDNYAFIHPPVLYNI